jgi:hypothetical protein
MYYADIFHRNRGSRLDIFQLLGEVAPEKFQKNLRVSSLILTEEGL